MIEYIIELPEPGQLVTSHFHSIPPSAARCHSLAVALGFYGDACAAAQSSAILSNIFTSNPCSSANETAQRPYPPWSVPRRLSGPRSRRNIVTTVDAQGRALDPGSTPGVPLSPEGDVILINSLVNPKSVPYNAGRFVFRYNDSPKRRKGR